MVLVGCGLLGLSSTLFLFAAKPISAGVTPGTQSVRSRLVIATANVTSATGLTALTSLATNTATSTARVLPGDSSALDRLVEGKPSIWGSKVFYILLVIVYLVTLVLLLRHVESTLQRHMN